MRDKKEHLNIDLGFLDQGKPRDAEVEASSRYKINRRNVAIVGIALVALIGWIALSNSPSSYNSTPSSYTPPTSYQNAPASQPPVADNSETIANGNFSCSSYDSRQADLLSPTNERELTLEGEALKSRTDQLEFLKTQIETNAVSSDSDQAAIARYDAMVARYNVQITSWKAGATSHQGRIDAYNQQVEARNNYLQTHCRSSQ
jgi:hypothetical protein